MPRVKVYSTGTCPICEIAKSNLAKWNIHYQEVRVDLDREGLKEMLEITNHSRTVPQFAIDGRWIGGFSDLTELHMDGQLDELVKA